MEALKCRLYYTAPARTNDATQASPRWCERKIRPSGWGQIAMTATQKTMVGVGATGAVFAAGVVAFVMITAGGRAPETRTAAADPVEEAQAPAENAIRVTAIHPKKDSSFVINVEEPAYVQAYYEAKLKARAAGPVSFIQKDIG